MREIKFRAWDLDNYNMYFSDQHDDDEVMWYFIDGKPCFSVLETIHSIQGGEHHESARYIEPKQELMQFTGLKDKNGVEIYEGDILLGEPHKGINSKGEREWDNIGVVYWDSGYLGNPNAKWNVKEPGVGNWPTWWMCGTKEVIGNIHQNPELLED